MTVLLTRVDEVRRVFDPNQVYAVASLAAWLDEITPDQPHQPLGTELPHRIVDYDAGPPVLGTQVAPAYAPNLPDSEPSTLPVTPTDADLAETIEVVFTDDIRSLATTLGADPVRMYEYVRNTIDFEPYHGSRKGANETLAQLAGNDMDTASLLIALYRASGIPARYVTGVVDVPIERAMNWVGVEVPELRRTYEPASRESVPGLSFLYAKTPHAAAALARIPGPCRRTVRVRRDQGAGEARRLRSATVIGTDLGDRLDRDAREARLGAGAPLHA